MPILMEFIGGLYKDRHQRGLVSQQSFQRGLVSQQSFQQASPAIAICNLHVVSSASKYKTPLLIADCLTPDAIRGKRRQSYTKPDSRMHILQFDNIIDAPISLLSPVLIPLSDILCIFWSDFDGLEEVAQFVQRWMRLGYWVPAALKVFRPSLLVVEERNEGAFLQAEWNASAVRTLREVFSSQLPVDRLNLFFLSVNVLAVPVDYHSLMHYFDFLLEHTQKIHKIRWFVPTPACFSAFVPTSRHTWMQYSGGCLDSIPSCNLGLFRQCELIRNSALFLLQPLCWATDMDLLLTIGAASHTKHAPTKRRSFSLSNISRAFMRSSRRHEYRSRPSSVICGWYIHIFRSQILLLLPCANASSIAALNYRSNDVPSISVQIS
jgi:hypothetical protein